MVFRSAGTERKILSRSDWPEKFPAWLFAAHRAISAWTLQNGRVLHRIMMTLLARITDCGYAVTGEERCLYAYTIYIACGPHVLSVPVVLPWPLSWAFALDLAAF